MMVFYRNIKMFYYSESLGVTLSNSKLKINDAFLYPCLAVTEVPVYILFLPYARREGKMIIP